MRARRLLCAALLAALVVSGAAACTTDDDGPTTLSSSAVTPSSSGSSASPTTSAAPTAEQQIEAQWKGYWTTLLSLQGADDNTIKVKIGQYAQPQQVNFVVQALDQLKAKGYTQTGGIDFGPLTVSVSGSNATVSECRDVSDQVVRDAAGTVVPQSSSSVAYQADLSLIEGKVWQVEQIGATEGPC